MYSWPHIKTLKFRMFCLTLRFPTENLYTFLFIPKDATCPHALIFLNYVLLRPFLSSTNLAGFLGAHSCTFLFFPTTSDHICNSQHSALEHPASTCDLKLSTR